MAERFLLLFDVDVVLVTVNENGELIRTRGSWEALSQVTGRTDAVQSLVTDDTEEAARRKISEVSGVGLERYLDLEVGAYGPDDRTELVALARNRAQERYGELTTLVVTAPVAADIAAAAKAADLVVTVAEEGADELRAAGAKHVVKSLVELVPLVLR